MRIAVTGASGVFGRGIAAPLRSQGHEVVGLARSRPQNWFSDSDFVEGDIRDAGKVLRAVDGADVVAHCAWVVNSNPDEKLTREINIGGTQNVLEAMDQSASRRIVFASSVLAYGARSGSGRLKESDPLNPSPDHFYTFHKAHVESLLAGCGKEWVAIRPGIVVGRDVDNTIMRLLGSPAFPNVGGSADRPMQIVHTDDVHRLFVRAVLDREIGAVNLAATSEPTVRDITSKLGRRLFPASKRVIDTGLGALYRRELVEASPAEFELLLNFPIMDTSRLLNEWGYTPAWNAQECLDDFELAVRGRICLGKKVFTTPWRMPLVQDIPAADEKPADGVALRPSGPDGLNGEFDSPVDPRFPTFVATNLSEALPGPFSPASASATVRGLRAGGVSIAERLRVPGVIGREIATRSVGTFAHRVYGGVTSVYYMALSMPGTDPDSLTDQFFGRELGHTPVFGANRPPQEKPRLGRRLLDLLSVGFTGVGLVAGSTVESRTYVGDVDRGLLPDDLTATDDNRLQSLISLARDIVVHGWMLSAWGALLCTATATAAARLGGGDLPAPGQDVASGPALASLRRLTDLSRGNPAVIEALSAEHDVLATIEQRAPELYRAVVSELAEVGHRGPAECELRSASYSDDPRQFVRMIAKSLAHQPDRQSDQFVEQVAVSRTKLAVRLAARQLRDREIRRDKVVRATWILRRLLREHARRLVELDVLDEVDDVFFFTVDELGALPSDPRQVVARRRAEMARLAEVRPPSAFSGSWEPLSNVSRLQPGQTLQGLGVSGGSVKGRVRIVDQHTIDDLLPDEVLVAEVTDVGYTPAFAYAGAVITSLGGPMSHAAIVAREFGVTCVVDARNATNRLPDGAMVEVDGKTGEIRLLEPANDQIPVNVAGPEEK